MSEPTYADQSLRSLAWELMSGLSSSAVTSPAHTENRWNQRLLIVHVFLSRLAKGYMARCSTCRAHVRTGPSLFHITPTMDGIWDDFSVLCQKSGRKSTLYPYIPLKRILIHVCHYMCRNRAVYGRILSVSYLHRINLWKVLRQVHNVTLANHTKYWVSAAS